MDEYLEYGRMMSPDCWGVFIARRACNLLDLTLYIPR